MNSKSVFSVSEFLNPKVLKFLLDHVEAYGVAVPKADEVKAFFVDKFAQKDIEWAVNEKVITQPEFCNFVQAHLFTKFIWTESMKPNAQHRQFEARLAELVFGD